MVPAFGGGRENGEGQAEEEADQEPPNLHTTTIARLSPTVKTVRLRLRRVRPS
jgi:hypothetical protein